MKHLRILCCIYLCCFLVLPFCGCQNPAEEEFPTGIEDSAVTQFQHAVDLLDATTSLKLNIVFKRTITQGASTLENHYVQALSLAKSGDDALNAYIQTNYTCGQVTLSSQEFYQSNTLYSEVNQERFRGEMNSETFRNQYLSPLKFDSVRYQTIYSQSSPTGMTITFSDAISDDNLPYTLICSDRAAVLDHDGNLVQIITTVQYQYHEMLIEDYVTVGIHSIQPEDVRRVNDPNSYTAITYPSSPKYLDFSAGYLGQAKNVHSSIQQICKSELTDLQYALSTQIHMTQDNANLTASVTYTSDITDFSREGQITHAVQTEDYQNGVYRYTDQNGDLQSTTDVTAESIREHILNLLVQNIIAPEHLSDAQISLRDGFYQLKFEVNDETAQILKEYTCESLTIDDVLLDELAQSYRTINANCILTMDAITTLPVSIEIHYSGEYVIENQAYPLYYDLVQTFSFSSDYTN